jgi:ATP-dependent RNA helicase DDX55/SPB4
MWRQFQTINKVDENIIKVIETVFQFDKITKVQNVVIPEFLKNKDVIVKSCTGSGKTLAYLIPVFQKIINYAKENDFKDKILSVIMLPSRELSIQVFNIFLKFVSNFEKIYKFTYALFIGGKKLQKDFDKINIEIPNIIIATPGRLFDIEEKITLSFKELQVLIIDEADKMLELGYESKVTNLLEKLPKQRRTGLFSATVNSQIENLIKVGMRNPIFIDVKVNIDNKNTNSLCSKTNEDIFIKENEIFQESKNNNSNNYNSSNELSSSYYEKIEIESNQNLINKKEEIARFTQEIPKQLEQFYFLFDNIKYKLPALIEIIIRSYQIDKMKKIMIFFATCNAVDYFSIILPKILESKDIQIDIFKLHSKILQKKRKNEYKNFLRTERGILLTTDLSARGIDVPNVELILQYDPPKNEEIYIHRVGRTARVGTAGKSLIFLAKIEDIFVKYLKQKNIFLKSFNEEIIYDDNLFNFIKQINISDKWIYEKAVKTFVSLTRFYCEHDLKYIFDIKTLDIGNLANSLALCRLPRIKEILGRKIDNFIQDDSFDPKLLTYQNTNTAKQMEIKEE